MISQISTSGFQEVHDAQLVAQADEAIEAAGGRLSLDGIAKALDITNLYQLKRDLRRLGYTTDSNRLYSRLT